MWNRKRLFGKEKKEKAPINPKRGLKGSKGRGLLALTMMLIMLFGSVQGGLFLMGGNHPTHSEKYLDPVDFIDDDHLGNDSKQKWVDYSQTVDTPDVIRVDPKIAHVRNDGDLKKKAELEGKKNFTDTGSVEDDGRSDGLYTEDSGAMMDVSPMKMKNSEEGAAPNEVQREVEEGDLIKTVGNDLFVLNSYRGLIIIDITEPALAHISGQVDMVGFPVEMYVVDFLAIVIVRTNYNYWNEYWDIACVSCKGSGTIGTMIYIINVGEEANPKVLKIVELEGFAQDSRRVGTTIYQVTNTHEWYNGEGAKDQTIVTSIDFSDPATLGMRDRVRFDGDTNQVHASSKAFYVAQAKMKDHPWWGFSWDPESDVKEVSYYTKVTYLDIRDPKGDIRVMDSFNAPGELNDKYQMDEYKNTFRMVTHFWINLGESKLFIYDISAPSNIKRIGTLQLDDAGTLMATRFAGDRAYTIHLPRSIDPLDVIDLSDPTKPKLCDVFEMPGWITHMEVFGTKIIALGADDSKGAMNVAVSLFDVSDPDNVVMEDRVRIGGDYSYSSANWEPKALTVDQINGLVIVPFVSWDLDTYNSTYGVQVVSFDLDTGDLKLQSEVMGHTSVERTRVMGHYILATSFKTLQVIDIEEPAKADVVKVLDLCVDVVDVLPVGAHYIQLVKEDEYGTMTLRSVKGYDDLVAIDTMSMNSNWGKLFRTTSGPVLATNMIDDKNMTGTIFHIKISKNGQITLDAVGTMPKGSPFQAWTRLYFENGYDSGMGIGYDGWYEPYYYGRDPSQRMVMSNDILIYLDIGNDHEYQTWEYDDRTHHTDPKPEAKGSDTLYLFDLSDPGNTRSPATLELKSYTHIGLRIHGDKVFIQHQYTDVKLVDRKGALDYEWTYKSFVTIVDINDPSDPRPVSTINIPGRMIGVGDDVIFTLSEDDDDGRTLLNTVSINEEMGTTTSVIDVGRSGFDGEVVDGKVYLVRSSYYFDYKISRYIPPTTKLKVIDVGTPNAPRLVTVMKFDRGMDIEHVGDGHLVLRDFDEARLLIYDTGSKKAMDFEAQILLKGNVGTVKIMGDDIYVLQGYYGISDATL